MAEKAATANARRKPIGSSGPKAAPQRRALAVAKTKPAPAPKPPKAVAGAPAKVARKPARTAAKAPAVPARTRRARIEVSVGTPDVTALPDLDEELKIESAKYVVREAAPARVFEEERFLFPETYDSDRVRLLVKDPEWLFAHWDVSPASWQGVRASLGERALALSRLTLKVEDPGNGALSVVLLPEGARSWYVRTQLDHRAYRAQLGLTTPSGEFRRLATSNVVVPPRVGPAPIRPRRRVVVSQAGEIASEATSVATPSPGLACEAAQPASSRPVALVDGNDGTPDAVARALPERGGASDAFSR